MQLFRRDNTTDNKPKAYSVQSSGRFDNHDGNWSTFNLDVGSPPQSFRVVPSTGTSQIWLPTPQGCVNGSYNATTGRGGLANFPTDCANARGIGLFQGSQNTGWQSDRSSSSPGLSVGPNAFQLDANAASQVDPAIWYPFGGNQTYSVSGALNPDYVSLNSDYRSSINTSSRAVVLGYAKISYPLPTLGLVPEITNNTRDQGSFESPILSLFSTNVTPSRSFGYTAGSYSDNQRLGSLTLGGYDLARINGTQARFNMKSSTSALQLTVSSMNFFFNNSTDPTLVSSRPFAAVIDTTLPYMELPNDVLQALADITGITYLAGTGFTQGLWYWPVNASAIRNDLVANARSLTFTLAANGTGTDATPLVIELPFASLYGTITPWLYNQTSTTVYSLPIRNASTTYGYVLGRAFLQEAYLFADYERGTFNLSRTTRGTPGLPTLVSVYSQKYNVPNNQSIDSNSTSSVSQSQQLSTGAIAGIAVGSAIGGLLILALIGALLWFLVFKRRRDARRRKIAEAEATAAATGARLDKSPDPHHRDSTWSESTWAERDNRRISDSTLTELSGGENRGAVPYRPALGALAEIGPNEKNETTELAANAEYQRRFEPVEMPGSVARYQSPAISPGLSGAPSPGVSTYRESM